MARIKRTLMAEQERRLQAATLGEIAADGLAVFCWCNRCGHNAQLDSIRLAAELGPDFPVPEVGGRLRCTGCNGKDIATRPAWRGLGTVTNHAAAREAGDARDGTPSDPATADPEAGAAGTDASRPGGERS
jgi:hypothetical protein